MCIFVSIVDDNECDTADCGSAMCKNTPGSYQCVCPGGIVTDTGSCDGKWYALTACMSACTSLNALLNVAEC